jgi:hypothetical protein
MSWLKRFLGFMSNSDELLSDGVEEYNLEKVVEAVEQGADFNKLDINGKTYLMKAIPFTEIMEYLIDLGIDINAQSESGMTALHYAVVEENYDSVQLLLEKGIDTAIPERHGWTALEIAKKGQLGNIVGLLEGRNLSIVESSPYRGDLDIPAGTTNAISYDDIEDGDEIVVLFGKTTQPNYIYKRDGIEEWFNKKKSRGEVLTNPLTNEPITSQDDIERYTARIVTNGGRRKRYQQRKTRVKGIKKHKTRKNKKLLK